jgi:hypothetical protein
MKILAIIGVLGFSFGLYADQPQTLDEVLESAHVQAQAELDSETLDETDKRGGIGAIKEIKTNDPIEAKDTTQEEKPSQKN